MRFDRDSLLIDLELTTHCNARCKFCPRDRFASYGRMSFDTYRLVVERINAMHVRKVINACGIGGDAAMHPDLVDYVKYATDRGIEFHLVTNGSRIDRKKGRQLIDAGLSALEFSINCTGQAYEEFYGLPFDVLVSNVRDFIEESNGQCRFQINLPKTRDYHGKFEAEKEFWRAIGVEHFLQLNYSNQVVMNTPDELIELGNVYADYRDFMAENALDIVCPIPLKVIVINWQGEYLLCEHDYTRSSVLGTVLENSIAEIQQKKIAYMKNESRICSSCSSIRDVKHIRDAVGSQPELLDEIRNMQADIVRFIGQL